MYIEMHSGRNTRKSPLFAISTIGLLVLGLAACDSKPTEQATRDVDQIVNRAPSPAAGKEGSVARQDQKGMESPDAAPAKQGADDAVLNIKVQDALKSDFTLKALPIIVQTTDGVVTLSGTADTLAHRDQATQTTMSVAGVKSVQNNLAVSGT